MNCRMDFSIYEDNSKSIKEKISCLELKQAIIISYLQSNISDSFKDGLRYELDLVNDAKTSFQSKI